MKTAPEALNSIAVIACPICNDRTRLYGVEPHIRLPHTEIHTYVCDACDTTEVVMVPMPRQNIEMPAAAQQ
jgi:C4-type Zn-finger protein